MRTSLVLVLALALIGGCKNYKAELDRCFESYDERTKTVRSLEGEKKKLGEEVEQARTDLQRMSADLFVCNRITDRLSGSMTSIHYALEDIIDREDLNPPILNPRGVEPSFGIEQTILIDLGVISQELENRKDAMRRFRNPEREILELTEEINTERNKVARLDGENRALRAVRWELDSTVTVQRQDIRQLTDRSNRAEADWERTNNELEHARASIDELEEELGLLSNLTSRVCYVVGTEDYLEAAGYIRVRKKWFSKNAVMLSYARQEDFTCVPLNEDTMIRLGENKKFHRVAGVDREVVEMLFEEGLDQGQHVLRILKPEEAWGLLDHLVILVKEV